MAKWGNKFRISDDEPDVAGLVRCMEMNARECGCAEFVVYRNGDAVGWCSPPAALSELPQAQVLSRHG